MIEIQFPEWLLWIFIVWVGLWIINDLSKILAPNWQLKRIMAGKQKLPSDNAKRVAGIIGLLISLWVMKYLIGLMP